jgi:hypothetical protein
MRPLALVLTILVSGLAQAEQPAPLILAPATAPAGYQFHIVDRPPRLERRWGLFTAGIVTFSGVWLANLQAGIPTQQVYLDIPLVGPLLEISVFTNRNYGPYDSGPHPVDDWMIFLLVTDAAVQMGGFAMMVAGAATKRSRPGGQSIQLVPLGAGAAIRGAF